MLQALCPARDRGGPEVPLSFRLEAQRQNGCTHPGAVASSITTTPGPPERPNMAEELTKEEIEQQARELARRVMSKPYRKQEWPRAKDQEDRSGVSTPRKPGSSDEGS